MLKKKNINENFYGIVGVGRFGSALAKDLIEAGANVLVLDKDEEKIKEFRELTENAFIVRSLDKKTLSETGIQNTDVAIVCIGEQIATSILTTLNLVSLGVKKVISKATSAEHGEILEKLGAEVVYPDRDMAERLSHRLEASRMLDFVSLSERLNVSKIAVPDKIVGKTVKDINFRQEFSVNIIAIESGKNLYEIVSPSYEFKKNDILFLCGGKDALEKISIWAS